MAEHDMIFLVSVELSWQYTMRASKFVPRASAQTDVAASNIGF